MMKHFLLLFVSLLLSVGGTAAASGWEDSFDGKSLNARWQWRVPVPGPSTSVLERPGWLRIRIPEREQGFNHWNEPKPQDDAPQLRTPAPPGDWELETRVHLHQFDPANHFHVGLVAGASDDHILVFGPFQAANLPGGPKSPEVCLELTGHSSFCRVQGDAREIRLRLTKTGTLCRARLSRNGTEWVDAGSCLIPADMRFVGVIGKTFSAGPPLVCDVDYIRLTPLPLPSSMSRRALVGIGGEYPTGYRGLLARNGLPHEVLLDYQLTDAALLRKFDVVAVGALNKIIAEPAREALMRYVQQGGIALLDTSAFPPPSIVAGAGGYRDGETVPDIVVGGACNPLFSFLGQTRRFKPGESRFHFEPSSLSGLQLLARFDGKPGESKPPRPANGYTGAPAIWAKPLGSGLFIYSSPAIGASLSWGPTHDLLAEALLRLVAAGRLEPQLVPEGERFGRKQIAVGEHNLEQTEGDTPFPAVVPLRQISSSREPLPAESELLEEETDSEYNISGLYHPQQGKAGLLLHYHSRAFMIGVSFECQNIRLRRFENGRAVEAAEISLPSVPEVSFLLKKRRDRIMLIMAERRCVIGAKGLWQGRVAYCGNSLEKVRYQPVGPAFVSDDFVRSEGEKGEWEALQGQWAPQVIADPKLGTNPFTYAGHAEGVGMSVTGRAFWDDYAFEVSVRPTTTGGMVGQIFYYQNDRDYFVFRLPVSGRVDECNDGAQVVRVSDGNESVLCRLDLCLLKGRWYRLSVHVDDANISAHVDGRRIATARDNTIVGGKVGLYLLNAQAEFDDVLVKPVEVTTTPSLIELDGAVPRFAGTLDRDTWAGTALQWRADPCVPGLFRRNGRFYGDFDFVFRCNFAEGGTARAMTLLLLKEGGPPDSGYALTLRRSLPSARSSGAVANNSYEALLARGGVPIERRNITASESPPLQLQRKGSRLLVRVDGRQIMECLMADPVGQLTQLAFLATGFRPRLSGLRLRAGSVLDYCFNRAPVDWWVGSGTWELAMRWPCTPEWSWFAGESRNIAALWHKKSFTGDVMLDIHIGPRTIDHGDGNPREICRAFNAVLCGDGQDVKSGYSFVAGAGKDGSLAILTRNGTEVARNTAFRFYSDAHNQWLNLRAEKESATVRLWIADQQVLTFNDPNPLTGGRVGIWTEDNSVMVPRITIYHRSAVVSPPSKTG